MQVHITTTKSFYGTHAAADRLVAICSRYERAAASPGAFRFMLLKNLATIIINERPALIDQAGEVQADVISSIQERLVKMDIVRKTQALVAKMNDTRSFKKRKTNRERGFRIRQILCEVRACHGASNAVKLGRQPKLSRPRFGQRTRGTRLQHTWFEPQPDHRLGSRPARP